MGAENPKNGKGAQDGSNLEEIKELYDFMCKESLDELEISRKDFTIKMVRNTARPNMQFQAVGIPQDEVDIQNQKEQSKDAAEGNGESIKAPLAGTFYRSSSPKSSAFISEGDKAVRGATLCILEAMKVMNEIKADRSCEIVKIVAENGKMVKAGETMFIIKSV